jgi:hypothetical protein
MMMKAIQCLAWVECLVSHKLHNIHSMMMKAIQCQARQVIHMVSLLHQEAWAVNHKVQWAHLIHTDKVDHKVQWAHLIHIHHSNKVVIHKVVNKVVIHKVVNNKMAMVAAYLAAYLAAAKAEAEAEAYLAVLDPAAAT